ncbi:MAG: type II TA system antitoxin MqsA family protein [Pseudomonadota bacterium]
MNRNECPVCGSGHLTETSEVASFELDGATLSYESHFSTCNKCGSEILSADQSTINKRAAIAAKNKHLGVPSPSELKAWRDRWGLTQHIAGMFLGVGPTAFSKYENAALTPSGPTARLLFAVINSDQATVELAKKYSVTLKITPTIVSSQYSLIWAAHNQPVKAAAKVYEQKSSQDHEQLLQLLNVHANTPFVPQPISIN